MKDQGGPAHPKARRRRLLPGFGLTLGLALTGISICVLLPLGALVLKGAGMDASAFAAAAFSPRALATYALTFKTSLVAALANALLGVLVAWCLTRYRFWGRRVLDGLVDLPFALPTAVAGIALTALYAPNGWLGRPLAALGVEVAFTPIGITLALIFIGLPFVVRTVQPVLEDLDPALEEAAATLGASRFTVFRRVVAPLLLPAVVTGFTLALARGLGEYGSVIFIAGNLPHETEITAFLIVSHLEAFDYGSATAVALVMLAGSLLLLLALNALSRRVPALKGVR